MSLKRGRLKDVLKVGHFRLLDKEAKTYDVDVDTFWKEVYPYEMKYYVAVNHVNQIVAWRVDDVTGCVPFGAFCTVNG